MFLLPAIQGLHEPIEVLPLIPIGIAGVIFGFSESSLAYSSTGCG